MPHVLVVADESWVINDVRASLAEPGYQLIEYDDPRAAIDACRTEAVDAAVVDLQISSMGGMAIVRSIRDATRTKGGIPTVLLLDRKADGSLARRAGADAWIQKPFTAFEIRTTIERLLDGGEDPT
jgi:DNA-binding response OmpR family regulator